MKTLLGEWEDSTDVLEYHAEQATKQKYFKFHQNHLKENTLIMYIPTYNRSFLVNINFSIAYKNV